MATRPDSMGIYGDLQRKRQASYDVALEKRVQAWIEGVLGKKLIGSNLREGLMDGMACCELINKIKPGTIKKIHKSPVVMFRRENFGTFQTACQSLGVRDNECCSFEDIYEDRNMNQCLTMFVALARNVQYKPGWSYPILQDAAKQATAQKQTFTKEQLARTAAQPTLADQHALYGQKVHDQMHYTEHGIVQNPDWQQHYRK